MNWGPFTKYKNAVTTELFIATAVGMYEAFHRDGMLEASIRAWIWFKNSGMINAQGLVNDGLTTTCQYPLIVFCGRRRNNGQTTWAYNQGIVLSGLSKLYKHTGDPSLIEAAQHLIDSVISSGLVPADDGILVESGDQARTCNQDQWMFKGVFFEHLGYFLWDVAEMQELTVATRVALLQKYRPFIHANAHAVWTVRGEDGTVSSYWSEPSDHRQVSVETLGSGVAALACAVRVDLLLESLGE